jgi:hypothetical protein
LAARLELAPDPLPEAMTEARLELAPDPSPEAMT